LRIDCNIRSTLAPLVIVNALGCDTALFSSGFNCFKHIEEIVVGLIHHHAVTDSLAEFGGGTLDQLIATSIVGLLILVPFFAFRTLGELVGEQNLVRVFLYPRHSAGE
jgi:hypothetical protein